MYSIYDAKCSPKMTQNVTENGGTKIIQKGVQNEWKLYSYAKCGSKWCIM